MSSEIAIDHAAYVVVLGPDLIQQARDYQYAVSETDTVANTENYTGLNEPDRYFYGELGTLATWELLKKEGDQVRI